MRLWQTGTMARGWESKGIESQKETAEEGKSRPGSAPRTPEELERQRERAGLELSRTRILRELESAAHPRHRASLEAALQFLEEKIASLE
jgi:transposase